MTYAEIREFHGHNCPGLAVGYRMARAALEALGAERAGDEELVAIVENDACGVDALQCLTGCTFGKGNLIFRNYGKQVYTLYSRRSRAGVRVSFHGRGIPPGLHEDREAYVTWLLSAPAEKMLMTRRVTIAEPEPARIRKSVECAFCGERVMESRARQRGERLACIPCFEENREQTRGGRAPRT